MQKVLQQRRLFESEQLASSTGDMSKLLLEESEIQRMRKYQAIVNSSIHPDTQKPVPWAMRMCAFLPTNLPIIFGMLMTTPTPASTAFWQWLNQTYNAGMNYGNRNASSKQTINDLLFGYSAAVVSSITISMGLRRMSANFTKNLTGGSVVLASSIINYLAVASAGFVNSYCMRIGEMNQGIKIYDEEGECMGVSKLSAKKAVLQTAFSRTILPLPIFGLPGVSMFLIDKMGMLPKSKLYRTALEIGVLTFSLWIALPLSVSLFPQKGEVNASEIESEFKDIRNGKGQVVTKFYYNKGL